MQTRYALSSLVITVVLFALILSMLLLTGCAMPGKGRTDTLKTYVISLANSAPESTQVAETGEDCPLLVINTPLSAPGISTSQMAYTRQNFRLDYFVKHAWVDTPARMLAPLLVQRLASTGLFSSVIANPTPVNADIRLDSEILDFQQEFTEDSSIARVSLRVTLVALNDRELILNKVFSAMEPATSNNPEGGVFAVNRAVAGILDNLVAALGQLDHDLIRTCRKDGI